MASEIETVMNASVGRNIFKISGKQAKKSGDYYLNCESNHTSSKQAHATFHVGPSYGSIGIPESSIGAFHVKVM